MTHIEPRASRLNASPCDPVSNDQIGDHLLLTLGPDAAPLSVDPDAGEPDPVAAPHDVTVASVRLLLKAGKAVEALAAAERASDASPSDELVQLRDRLRRGVARLLAAAPERMESGESTAVVALGCVLRLIAERRGTPPETRQLGRVSLITGHLGAGGAELQMTRTAEMLASAARARRSINGFTVRGPVHVVVKTLEPESHRPLDFFRPRLIANGIPVDCLDTMPEVAPEDLGLDDPAIEDLLHLVPAGVRKGLRIAPWFRANRISTAYIWQDGSILDCAVAALLAKVPRLVVNFRGMPPLLRWKERLEEYRELYCALAQMPGVVFVSNSAVAASAYAQWLSCPPELFHIIRNGVAPHAPHPLRREIDTWSRFAAATADATVTIGGIFRMHPNKRPLEWLRFARRYLDSHPHARFVLIGSGILIDEVRELTERLGLSRRLLLIPQTWAGAYWLAKMDAFVLLSRFEGTPNVLIEAQLAGVPVVTTRIANSADTFIEGITGLSTENARFLDVEDVVVKVDRVLTYAKIGNTVYDHARRHIASRYSPKTMIEHTVKVLAGGNRKCCSWHAV